MRINLIGSVPSKFASADNYGSKRGQGGVAILWNVRLTGLSEVKNITYDRVCAVRVQTSSGKVLIIYSVYLPSRGSPEEYATAINDLIEIIDSREEGSNFIIGGDINGDLGSACGSRSKGKVNDRGTIFLEVVKLYNLTM